MLKSFTNKTTGGTMKYKATEKFKELGIENSYHQLDPDDLAALQAGETVDIKLDNNNQYLSTGKYIEKVTEKSRGKHGFSN